jgi:CelD/BcsL family acetyltransferase involved in cellulose biosynthesis
MYSEVVWPVRRPHPSLLVPPTSIVTTTERTFVIRGKDGVAEWVTVSRGARVGDLVEVFGPLKGGDVIVRRGYEHEGLAAIADVLAADGTSLHLRHLPAASSASALSEKLASRGWMRSESQIAICPVISLAGHTWDSYLAELSASHRANVRRRIRALERGCSLRVDEVRTESARAEALSTLFHFHQARWGDRSTAFSSPELRAFHDDVTRLALEEGWLRLYVMTLNRAPAGVMYGFAYGDTFYFYQHACDERYQSQSAGLALMGMTIQAAMEEGLSTFDMLYGNEAYKSHWARDHRPLMALRAFPAHIRGALHRRTVAAERSMRALVRRMLDHRSLGEGGLPNGDRRAA